MTSDPDCHRVAIELPSVLLPVDRTKRPRWIGSTGRAMQVVTMDCPYCLPTASQPPANHLSCLPVASLDCLLIDCLRSGSGSVSAHAAYPECVLGAAAYVITRLEISDGAQSFEADTYGTCRLNIPWQCCYDPGLGACTVPGDGSQYGCPLPEPSTAFHTPCIDLPSSMASIRYCYMSAHNCLVDCGGGEFCHCDDTVHGVGCEPGWFVPGAEGTDKHGNVTCNTKPPGMASSAFDGASSATYAISGAPCYTGRAEYGKKMCV